MAGRVGWLVGWLVGIRFGTVGFGYKNGFRATNSANLNLLSCDQETGNIPRHAEVSNRAMSAKLIPSSSRKVKVSAIGKGSAIPVDSITQ
jgi:hypothetical protein